MSAPPPAAGAGNSCCPRLARLPPAGPDLRGRIHRVLGPRSASAAGSAACARARVALAVEIQRVRPEPAKGAGDNQAQDRKAGDLMQGHVTGFQSQRGASGGALLGSCFGPVFPGKFRSSLPRIHNAGSPPIGVAANRCIPYAASYWTVRPTWLIRLIAEFGGASY